MNGCEWDTKSRENIIFLAKNLSSCLMKETDKKNEDENKKRIATLMILCLKTIGKGDAL
jgi:hypothetical protein